jgi:hypothetical protein
VHADLRELPQVRGVTRAIAELLHEHADLLAGRLRPPTAPRLPPGS